MRKLAIEQVPTHMSASELSQMRERGYAMASDAVEAGNLAPWAAEIIETASGWIAFESVSDADAWRDQE